MLNTTTTNTKAAKPMSLETIARRFGVVLTAGGTPEAMDRAMRAVRGYAERRGFSVECVLNTIQAEVA